VIGWRYYRNASDSIIDLVDGDELDLLDRGLSTHFVTRIRNRTGIDLVHACMLWNTLRIRLGYEHAQEEES